MALFTSFSQLKQNLKVEMYLLLSFFLGGTAEVAREDGGSRRDAEKFGRLHPGTRNR